MPVSRAKVVNFRDYRGLQINGTVLLGSDGLNTHLDEVSWLTAQVESNGRFGSVMNYDGTGMTAGIHQAIAVYPRAVRDNNLKNDQGPLWKLMSRMKSVGLLVAIESHLEEYGVYLSSDSKCLWNREGKIVEGKFIRSMFTGDEGGVMPTSGRGRRECTRWVKEFHEAFSDEAGFGVQLHYGAEHFEKMSRKPLRYCHDDEISGRSILDVFYGGTPLSSTVDLPEHYSLAMSMFWSHSVNAPGFALKKLCRQVADKYLQDVVDKTETASRAIIQALGDTPFARWDDDLKNGRYQRTRTYAKRKWAAHLFGDDGVMPKNIS
jgi:hypothetical protein